VPPRILGGERIQDDGDEGLDVLDHNNVSVEVGNHGSIPGGGVVVWGGYGVIGLTLGAASSCRLRVHAASSFSRARAAVRSRLRCYSRALRASVRATRSSSFLLVAVAMSALYRSERSEPSPWSSTMEQRRRWVAVERGVAHPRCEKGAKVDWI
jgi:hypothetical protein